MRLATTALAIGLTAMVGPVFAVSVTVHSDGVSGDFASISQALLVVQTESAGPDNPDIITILDAGPFREGALIITGDAHANDIVIRAAEGIRPILVSTHTGASAIEIRKNGRAEIRDLIIIPAANISQTATRAILYEAPASGSTGYDYHLENILISSNNRNDQPVASLDGLGTPMFGSRSVSFRGDGGIRGSSTDESNVYRMTMRHVVVSCIRSSAPYGFRSFHDGAAGSELIIGEGCVFSHIHSTTTTGAAVNIGGMEGTPNIGRIEGSEDNPVLIVKNGVFGLYLTGTNEESNLVSNAIIAGNARDAIFLVNPLMSTTIRNVTVANNNSHPLRIRQNDGSVLNYQGTFSVIDSIIAGIGTNTFTNSIYVSMAQGGSLNFQDSAIVRFGPYRLNSAVPNGMSVSGSGTVVLDRVIFTDPQFAPMSINHPNFGAVSAPDYSNAASDGTPLRGGGKYGDFPAQEDFAWYHYN